MDDLRRAYAVLGLEPGCSSAKLKQRYRALVRTWHPDRHGADARGQAEAGVRMRAINAAYRLLLARRRPDERRSPAPAGAQVQPPPGRRLTREEIDAMIRAINGPESRVDTVLGAMEWVGETVYGLLAMLSVTVLLIVVIVRLGRFIWTGDVSHLVGDPRLAIEVLIFGLILGGLGLQEWWQRRRLRATLHDDGEPAAAATDPPGRESPRPVARLRERSQGGTGPTEGGLG